MLSQNYYLQFIRFDYTSTLFDFNFSMTFLQLGWLFHTFSLVFTRIFFEKNSMKY